MHPIRFIQKAVGWMLREAGKMNKDVLTGKPIGESQLRERFASNDYHVLIVAIIRICHTFGSSDLALVGGLVCSDCAGTSVPHP